MTKVKELPLKLQPYAFHGVEFNQDYSAGQALAECPFCGKQKFYVNVENGKFDCKVCSPKGGNAYTFLKEIYEASQLSSNNAKSFDELKNDRKLLFAQTIITWGVRQNKITDEWIVPGYNGDRKLSQLYKYTSIKHKDGTYGNAWLPTPGLEGEEEQGKVKRHGILGVNLYDDMKDTVIICEGIWDAMALWEVMRNLKIDDTTESNGEGPKLIVTGTEQSSLLGNVSILAVPGCNIFLPSWAKYLEGKNLYLMFDNDHSKIENGKELGLQGYFGMQRVCKILSNCEQRPNSVKYLRWSKNTEENFNKHLDSGFDVRDWLSTHTSLTNRGKAAIQLLDKLTDIPEEWLIGDKSRTSSQRAGTVELSSIECKSWSELVSVWHPCMEWIEGLDRAFSIMIATILSTEFPDEQLWIKVISTPSSGKTVLCEALSTNRKYVRPLSTIRGFHSGIRRDDNKSNSLIDELDGMTLVTKDGDTLLASPNKQQILSEARDIYDGAARTHYRNGLAYEKEHLRVTWILAGTESLRELDDSELGERFIDVVIVDKMKPEDEQKIALKVANRILKSVTMAKLTKDKDGIERSLSIDNEEVVKAKRVTAGYIDYLKSNSQEILSKVRASDRELALCQKFAKFISYMRSRPSKRQKEKTQREMSYRLTAQLTRLAICLAGVLNKSSLEREVIRRIARTALDTSRGRTIEIVKILYNATTGDEPLDGLQDEVIAIRAQTEDQEMRFYLRHLRKLGVVQVFNKRIGVIDRKLYSLNPEISELYKEIITHA